MKNNKGGNYHATDFSTLAFSRIREVIIIVEKSGFNVISANPAFYRALQYHPEDIENTSIFNLVRDFYHPDLKKMFELPELYQERYVYLEFVDKSGKEHPYEIAVNILEDEGGFLVSGRNVMERKVAAQRESDLKEQLLFLSRSSMDFLSQDLDADIYDEIGKKLEQLGLDSFFGVFELDHDGQYAYLKRLVGLQEETLLELKEDFGTDYLSEKVKLSAPYIQKLRSGGFNYLSREDYRKILEAIPVRNVDAVLDKFGMKCAYSVGVMYEGKLFGFIEIICRHEIPPEKKELLEAFIRQASVAVNRLKLEENLREAKEKAEQSDKLKTAFLANISHEIRTPMNAILGFGQLLRHPTVPQIKKNGYLKIIEEKGNDLLRILNDLIDISLIESKQLVIEKKPFLIKQLLEEAYTYYASRVKSGISFSIDNTTQNREEFMCSDPIRIKQVLNNLLNNAVKFTLEGYIQLGYYLEGEKVIFFVKDSGIGIPKHKQEIVFQRFRQGSSDFARSYGGNGLGLTIAKELVEMLGGEIWMDSEVGKGSFFYFSIPFERKDELEVTQTTSDMTEIDFTGCKILIAEDDDTNFEYLNEILESKNADIIWAKDGLEALQYYRSNDDISLILMDLKMPKLDGLEATGQIRRISQKVPIIAQTAYAMDGDKEKCLQAGCNDYMTKPIKKNELLSLIKDYLVV